MKNVFYWVSSLAKPTDDGSQAGTKEENSDKNTRKFTIGTKDILNERSEELSAFDVFNGFFSFFFQKLTQEEFTRNKFENGLLNTILKNILERFKLIRILFLILSSFSRWFIDNYRSYNSVRLGGMNNVRTEYFSGTEVCLTMLQFI